MTMTRPEQDSLVGSIREMLDERDEALRSDSSSRLSAYKRTIAAKDIIQAVIFFGGLVYAASIAYQDIREKPSTEDVATAIEETAHPIREQATANAEKLEDIDEDVSTLTDLVELVSEEQAYHSDLLDCLATKSCRKPPPKPPSIERRRRELLSPRSQ